MNDEMQDLRKNAEAKSLSNVMSSQQIGALLLEKRSKPEKKLTKHNTPIVNYVVNNSIRQAELNQII
jgi:hypothetical protein